MYLPVALFRMHALVFFIYLTIVSIEELFSHCGYKLFPVGGLEGIAVRVDRHLDGGGNHNYGLLGFWDLLCGTYEGDDGDYDDGDHYSDRSGHKSKGQRGGGPGGGGDGRRGRGGGGKDGMSSSSKSSRWGPLGNTKLTGGALTKRS